MAKISRRSEGAGRAWWSGGARGSAGSARRGVGGRSRSGRGSFPRAATPARARGAREGAVLGPEGEKYQKRAQEGVEKAARGVASAPPRGASRPARDRSERARARVMPSTRDLHRADAAGRPRTDGAETGESGSRALHPRRKSVQFGIKGQPAGGARRTSWRRGGEAPRVARGSPRRTKKRGQTSPRVSSCELQSCAQREHVVIRSHQPAPSLAAEKRRRMTQPRERDSGRYSVAYWYNTTRDVVSK